MTFDEWYDTKKQEWNPVKLNKCSAIARAAWDAAVNYTMAELPQGHDEFCEFCGERCNGFAGNPSEWPIALCHPDGTGIVKWHHERCVSERIWPLGVDPDDLV